MEYILYYEIGLVAYRRLNIYIPTLPIRPPFKRFRYTTRRLSARLKVLDSGQSNDEVITQNVSYAYDDDEDDCGVVETLKVTSSDDFVVDEMNYETSLTEIFGKSSSDDANSKMLNDEHAADGNDLNNLNCWNLGGSDNANNRQDRKYSKNRRVEVRKILLQCSFPLKMA